VTLTPSMTRAVLRAFISRTHRLVPRVLAGAELKHDVGNEGKGFAACRGKLLIVGLDLRVDGGLAPSHGDIVARGTELVPEFSPACSYYSRAKITVHRRPKGPP